MSSYIFRNLSKSYFQASRNAFYYVGQAPLLLKPVVLVIALFQASALMPVGFVFSAFVFLDWISWVTDIIRRGLLRWMQYQSESVANSLWSFLLRPILLVLIAPLFFVSLLIPKLSGNASVNMVAEEVSSLISGAGAFKKINAIIWGAAHQLFVYVANAPLLLKPITGTIAIPYSLVLIAVGGVFFILIPLDWVSSLVETMRQGVIRFVDYQQKKIRYSFIALVLVPVLLVALAPLFLAIVLVPKFTTAMISYPNSDVA